MGRNRINSIYSSDSATVRIVRDSDGTTAASGYVFSPEVMAYCNRETGTAIYGYSIESTVLDGQERPDDAPED